MRDIKFRVFNEVTGKMSQVKTMCGRYVWDSEIDPVYDSPQKMIDTAYDIEDKSHLMQFTGLKDAKGVDIYENDIIKEYGCLYRVSFDYSGTRMVGIGKRTNRLITVFDESCVLVTVVGNVFENPELLKEKP